MLFLLVLFVQHFALLFGYLELHRRLIPVFPQFTSDVVVDISQGLPGVVSPIHYDLTWIQLRVLAIASIAHATSILS